MAHICLFPDPADLDLEDGYSEPELCFSVSQKFEIQHLRYLIVELLW